MKIPMFPMPALPPALSPAKAIPSLRMGLAELARVKRAFTPAAAAPAAGAPHAGVLQEVTSFGANPGALKMWLFTPPKLPPGAPLVVVLHGCTQTAAGYDRGSGWSTLAARHGFALLYPEQQRANNSHTCFNWFEPGDVTRGKGEVASIRDMTVKAIAMLRSNPARVFVTGLSAGGAMTAALLATYPDVFAGGAVIAGLPYGAAHSVGEAMGAMYHPTPKTGASWMEAVHHASPAPQRKPVVSIWHGTADSTVQPANAAELAKQWRAVHGLEAAEPDVEHIGPATRQLWRGADGAVRVELTMVAGLGHGTPIDSSAPGGQGVGVAMPHMLEGKISSTWHIANDWGLLT